MAKKKRRAASRVRRVVRKARRAAARVVEVVRTKPYRRRRASGGGGGGGGRRRRSGAKRRSGGGGLAAFRGGFVNTSLLAAGAFGGLAMIGTGWALDKVGAKVPMLASGWGRTIAKVGAGLGLYYGLRRFGGNRMSPTTSAIVAAGPIVSATLDIAQLILSKMSNTAPTVGVKGYLDDYTYVDDAGTGGVAQLPAQLSGYMFIPQAQ